VFGLSVGTELNISLCVFSLTVLNCTNVLCSFCLYFIVHIPVCGQSDCPALYKLVRWIFLTVLKCTNCWVSSVWSYWTLQNALFLVSAWTVYYALVCVLCLSLMYSTHCCVWSFFRYRNEHIDICVSFPLLNCTYNYVCSVLWYWTLHYAVCCLSLAAKLYTLLWEICLYWNVHIAVCSLSVVTELHTLLCVVSLPVPNCTYGYQRVICRYWTLHNCV